MTTRSLFLRVLIKAYEMKRDGELDDKAIAALDCIRSDIWEAPDLLQREDGVEDLENPREKRIALSDFLLLMDATKAPNDRGLRLYPNVSFRKSSS